MSDYVSSSHLTVKSRRLFHSIILIVLGFVWIAAAPVQAASGTWTGSINANWQLSANWTGASYPNFAGETATFNGTGNSNTNITLGGGAVTVGNFGSNGLLFDTPSVSSYTIGNGTLNTFQGSFIVRMNPLVINNQVVTANIVTDSQNILYTTEHVLNYSPVANLTLNNLTVAAGASGTGSSTYYFRGLGAVTVAGPITDNTSGAAPRLTAVANYRAAPLVLSGANAFTGAANGGDTPQSLSVGLGGTVVLDYSSGNTVLTNGSTVTPGRNGSGHLVLKGRTTGSTTLTLGSTTRFAHGYTTITVDNNGGAGTTLILGSDWRQWNATSGGKLTHFDLSSSGQVQVIGTISGGYSVSRGIIRNTSGRSSVTVKGTDGKTYYATNDASGYIVAQTTMTTMPTSGGGDFNVNYKVATDTTLTGVGQFAGNTLRIEGTSANQTLNMGGRNWNGAGAILMDGTEDFTLSNFSNLTPGSGLIVMGPGKLTLNGTQTSGDLEKWGPGLLEVTGSHIASSGATWIWGGTYRAASANALSAGVLNMADGVLELGYNFTRALGSSSGQIRARDDGFGSNQGASFGFSAYGGDRTVNLGGASASITFGAGGFVASRDAKFMLSSPTADSTVDFQNPLNLNADHQAIEVRNGSAAVDAILSGVLSNGGLIKTGDGTLSITGNNTYGLGTTLAAGTTMAQHNNAFGTGTVALIGTSILMWDTDSRTLANPIALGGGSLGGINSLTLNGAVSGPGNIVVGYADPSKLLTLGGVNSYRGTTVVNSGTLVMNGSHTGGGAYTVAAGAILAGTGSIGSTTTVSGILSPGSSGNPTGTLAVVGDVIWNGGASASSATDWRFQIGPGNTSDVLHITGNFNRGSGNAFRFDFGGASQLGTFKLVEWTDGTTFNASDFSSVNTDGNTVFFQIVGNQLEAVVTAPCATLPSITLGGSPTVCQGTTNANLPYTGTTGSPDQYFIDYSSAANAVGFIDTTFTALGGSPLVLTIASFTPAGIYTGTVYVARSGDGCRGSANFTVQVIATPATPGGISGQSAVCSGSTGITYSISAVSGATNYTWSVPSGASITAGQGTTSISVNWGSTPGNVTVNAGNSCGTSGNATLGVTIVASVPGAPTAQAATDVSLDSFFANWSAGSGTIAGYRLDVATSIDFTSGFVLSNQAVGGTSYELSGLESGVTYFYRVRSYNACGDSSDSVTITVLTPLVLAGWDVSGLAGGSGNFGASPLNPTTYATGQVSVAGFIRGPGVTQSGTAAAKGWGGTAWDSGNANAAISVGQYATCVVEAVSGRLVSFLSIGKLDYRRGANGPGSGLLQYSVDGANYTDITTLNYSSTSDSGGSIAVPVNLSGISALQGVSVGTPVTFRIVNYGASGAAEPWYIYDTANSSAHDFDIRGVVCETPFVYGVTGGGTYCSGSSPPGSEVGLAGSQVRVSYQLYRYNGGSPIAVGSPKGGTGGAISFGRQTVVDTYTVKATRNSGGCAADMSGSAVVTVTVSPGVPTGFSAVVPVDENTNTLDNLVDLEWTSPGGAVSGYNVKRSASFGGPYTTVAGGANVQVTTFRDSSVLNGNTYYYIVTALNDGCEGVASEIRDVVMPEECLPGFPPTMTRPANQTVLVFGTPLSLTITASDSSGCQPATMINSTLPSGMNTSDLTSSGSRTRQFTWSPGIGQVGTYPITVTATDEDNLSTSVTFIVYVGAPGEPGNPPLSQTNWSVAITNLLVPSSGNATVVWVSVEGIQYDLLSSANPVGAGASWVKEGSTIEADGTLATSSVAVTGSRYYQVVPSGHSASGRGVWGVVRPNIPTGYSFLSIPVGTNRTFDGEMGDALAAALPQNTLIYIMSAGANPNWTTLRLNGSSQWVIDGTSTEYTTPLPAGQGIMVNRPSGTTSPTFIGPVGNNGNHSIGISSGYNIIGISEGKGLAASTAFENAGPVGSFDESQADQVVIQNANGSWRRLIRRTNGTWYDTGNPNSSANTSFILMPGQSYYYIRVGSNTAVSF
jgi:autotransporter-associated beta strand protein